MKINLGLTNKDLYHGCQITEVAGRLVLTTPVADAINIVGRNINELVSKCENRNRVVLTGPMAVWSYLIVFHAVVHTFRVVEYDDGKGNCVVVAQHG